MTYESIIVGSDTHIIRTDTEVPGAAHGVNEIVVMAIDACVDGEYRKVEFPVIVKSVYVDNCCPPLFNVDFKGALGMITMEKVCLWRYNTGRTPTEDEVAMVASEDNPNAHYRLTKEKSDDGKWRVTYCYPFRKTTV